MKITVTTFDRFYNGQQIQEQLGLTPTANRNIGYNHALNGDDWAIGKDQHPHEWSDYAAHFLQAEHWMKTGKVFFKRDDLIIKVMPDGNAFCCVGEGFIDLIESENYAFGDTFEEAITNFKALGKEASNE